MTFIKIGILKKLPPFLNRLTHFLKKFTLFLKLLTYLFLNKNRPKKRFFLHISKKKCIFAGRIATTMIA